MGHRRKFNQTDKPTLDDARHLVDDNDKYFTTTKADCT